ncbi:MAG: class I SAM-dependent methyltransferase [Kiritimatiellae bacterium]|jgi:23S rRNA (cytosine1962-C5)-methyltransferase|nr:class I SAM-dependent methyltransferase [Kiritimatiellia bacterium]
MNTATTSDYELLDSGDGRKLERFGDYTLVRPCSQAVWKSTLSSRHWDAANATFDRAEGNQWHNRGNIPTEWKITTAGITFILSGTDFGHLGIFPEQRNQWEWLQKTVQLLNSERSEPLKVLNLFAYSGGSTLASALGGAHLCHLDASKGMVQWARRNAEANGLANHPIRWIVDDAHKFLSREIRRGNQYDAIILDPPTFGRGQNNEMYKIEKDLQETLNLCRQLLSENPAFILLSAHTPGYSPVVLENVLGQSMSQYKGSTSTGEMLLTGASDVLPTPCGVYSRWMASSVDS